jgi:hypothetical protein
MLGIVFRLIIQENNDIGEDFQPTPLHTNVLIRLLQGQFSQISLAVPMLPIFKVWVRQTLTYYPSY